MPLSDVIRRSGASEPYPDAVAVKKTVQVLEKRPIQFAIDAAGTVNLVAMNDGKLSSLFVVANAVLAAGTAIVRVNSVPVAGLSVTFAGGEAIGTRFSDEVVTGDGTERVRRGDRIEVVVTGANAIRGFIELTADA
jgi:hypothetical protein